jgi:hypothetical protein
MELTEDIKPRWRNWLNIARRLQAEGCKQEGLAIARFFVVLNSKGEPIHWISPKITLIEPKRKISETEFKTLVDIFGDEFLERLTDI